MLVGNVVYGNEMQHEFEYERSMLVKLINMVKVSTNSANRKLRYHLWQWHNQRKSSRNCGLRPLSNHHQRLPPMSPNAQLHRG